MFRAFGDESPTMVIQCNFIIPLKYVLDPNGNMQQFRTARSAQSVVPRSDSFSLKLGGDQDQYVIFYDLAATSYL